MNKALSTTVLLWAALAAGSTTGADGASSLTFSDGTRLSFELVRSVGRSRTPLGSGVMTGHGEGYRLVYDSKGDRFYGYAVKATPLPKGGFRLELGPLAPELVARIAREHEESEGVKLVGQSLALEYPPAQDVRDDEPLLLELMVNPSTGEKLSDLIRVTSVRKPAPEPDRLAVRDGILKVDGEEQKGTGGVAGRYIYFALPGRGRFVISAEEVGGYDFVPARLIANRTIKFDAQGVTYEWTSAEPIVPSSPALDQVWVWHDGEFRAGRSSFGVGAMPSLPRR